jgi:hypothetical protein
MAPKGYHRALRNEMLANLSDEEYAEITSRPQPDESVEAWLAREDAAMLARYTDRKWTRPRPVNGHSSKGYGPREAMERCLTLPTPMAMRLAIACDILELYPPTEAEIAEYKAKYPEWPKDLPRITVEVTKKG